MTQFVVDLLDASNNPIGSGPLQNVISVEVGAKLDESANVSFTVPSTDDRVATLLDTAARFRVRLSSGAVHYGIIKKDTNDVADERPTRTVVGSDMLRELQHYSMGWWCFFADLDINTVVLPKLVADTPWSLGTVDAALGNLYYRFDGDSRLAALFKIAKNKGKHFRLGSTFRTLDFGAFGTLSSKRLTNVDHGLAALDSNTDIAIIGSLRVITDRGPVVNRIIPWGAGQDGGDTNRAKVSLFHLTPGDSRWANIKAKAGVLGASTTVSAITDEFGKIGNGYTVADSSGFYLDPVNQLMWAYDISDLTLGIGYNMVPSVINVGQIIVRGSPDIPTPPVSFPATLISNPQLYIEDAAAYAADPHESVIIFPDVTLTDTSTGAFELAASQLYERAYNYLQEYKVPQVVYAVSVYNCPDDLRVGDTINLTYRGVVTRDSVVTRWVNINENLSVIGITRIFMADGSTKATIEVSNIARQPVNSATAMTDYTGQGVAMSVTVGSPSVGSGSGGGGGSGGAGDPLTFALPLVRTINNITLPLTNAQVFVGNVSNVPVGVTISNDATLSNTGVLTLKDVGPGVTTVGDATHVAQVTLDTKGRVTALSSVAIVPAAGSITPAMLAVASTQYRLLTSGATPFAYAESGYMLDGTAGGKTVLAVTSGKTLTITAADDYNVTIPATGTVALLGIVNSFTDSQAINYSPTDSVAIAHYALNNVLSATPDADSAGSWSGAGFDARLNGTVNLTSASGGLRAFTAVVRHAGSGTLTLGIGSFSTFVSSGGGTTTAFHHFEATSTSLSSGTAGEMVAFYANNIGGSGVTNSYALRIANQAGSGTASYAIYAGTAPNGSRLAHHLAIAGSTNTNQLVVAGHTTQTGSLIAAVRSDISTGIRSVLSLDSAGSGADGDGGSVLMAGKSSTTAAQSMAAIKYSWASATHASRKAKVDLTVYDTAERTGLTIEADGAAADVYFTGAGGGLPYGSCWGNEIGWSQASAAQDTWYIISDTDMTDGQLNLVTHDGSGKLTVTKAGRYYVVYTVSQTNDRNNKHIQTGIAINGTVQNDGVNHVDGLAANIDTVLSGNAILALTASQYIEIAIRTTDTGTPTISVDHLNVTIFQVGG